MRFAQQLLARFCMFLVVKPFTFSSGGVIYAEEHNENFDAIFEILDAGITDAHISDDACIDMAKIDWSGCDPCDHADRHCTGGADPLPAGCLDANVISNPPWGDPPTAGTFEAPAYDSGWQVAASGNDVVLNHNLGLTDTSNVVVQMFMRESAQRTSTPWGVINQTDPHNIYYGSTDVGSDVTRGCIWKNLTANSITIRNCGGKFLIDPSVRILIWKVATS